jgi:predicted N-acetyltransferase YhbS
MGNRGRGSVSARGTAGLADVSIRRLSAGDLDAADDVMRTAFGAYFGRPIGDLDYVRSRFAAGPEWAFAAELDGEVVGSGFATRWGSYALVGPVTVRVDLWDRGIGGC